MTLPPRVLLHVGMAKTGSTAMQNFMEAHHDALRAQGVLFPRSVLRRSNPRDPLRTPGHLDLIRQLVAGTATPLLAECAEAGPGIHTLFLSVENIFNIEPEKGVAALARFLAGREVRIVAVLRAPQDWIASRYYEVVTTGQSNETRTIDAYVEEALAAGALDYPARLERLRRAFSAVSVEVHDYREIAARGTAVSTFLDALGVIVDAPEAAAAPRVNVSLSYPESLEAHRRLNLFVRRLPLARRFAFAEAMKARYAGLAAAGTLRPGGAAISRRMRARLVAAVAPGCREVSARWFGGRPFGPDQAWVDADPPPPDEALVAAIQDFGFEAFLAEVDAAPAAAAAAQEPAPSAGRRPAAPLALTAGEARHLRRRCAAARVVLAYGADEDAAFLAGTMAGKLLLGVEDDRARALELQRALDAAALPSPTAIRHVDLAGDPAEARRRYALAIWDEPFFRHPDLILLGGRFAAARLGAALARVERPTLALFPGYARRPGWAAIERAIRPERLVDGMAEFRLEPQGAPEAAAALLADAPAPRPAGPASAVSR